MSIGKSKVVERLRAKITNENRIFVRKNLAISEQISAILKEKGWTQKQLAQRLGKNESEVSKLLSGLHNLTLKSIARLEAVLGTDIIVTPLEMGEKYNTTRHITYTVYVPANQPEKTLAGDFVGEETIEYKVPCQHLAS
jgi:transcriptional regulator with XRE-family HTH domain